MSMILPCRSLKLSVLTQFLPVCMYDQSLIKLDNNHMLKSFSNIPQSSLIEFAFQLKDTCCKLAQAVQNSCLNQALKHTEIILKTSYGWLFKKILQNLSKKCTLFSLIVQQTYKYLLIIFVFVFCSFFHWRK